MDGTSLMDVVIAPLTWLERSRGWRRRGLASAYLTIAILGGALGWREVSLWRLPDAPEPFDVARLGRLAIPDRENAMVAYRAIFARAGDLDYRGTVDRKKWDGSDWSTADPSIRGWAEGHRALLAAWLPATDLDESLLVQPEDLTIATIIGPVQALRSCTRLALLEASRLQGAGDLDGAWRMIRAALRASRHAGRHGGGIQRVIGSSLLKMARPRVEGWADDPRVTSGQLRRAIRDVEAAARLTSPASEMVRAEYFSARDAVAHPEDWGQMADDAPGTSTLWYNHLNGVPETLRFLRREPERTGRVLRLITAGYLAQCDRPPAVRAKLAFPESLIYDLDGRTPGPLRSLTPGELRAWAESSSKIGLWNYSSQIQALIDAEPGTFDGFRLRMAERAFAIDRGRPAATYGDLLGPYLGSLPAGIEPGDLTGLGPG